MRPIVDGIEYAASDAFEKIDVAEVAALDATVTPDAKAFYDDMGQTGNGLPSWVNGDHYFYHVAAEKPNVTKDNCVSIGMTADFVYIAGHGLPSRATISGDTTDHPLGWYGNPLTGKEFTPDAIGNNWSDGECEWVVFAVCNQVRIDNPAAPNGTTDNAVKWIKKMPKVHALLGYRDIAPQSIDDDIARAFVDYLHGTDGKAKKSVVEAWMAANSLYQEYNASALVQKECIGDTCKTLDKFPMKDGEGAKYIFYWFNGTSLSSAEITLP